MKKILYILFAVPFFVLGQSTDQNYIKSTTYKQPTTTSVSDPDVTVANVQVSYFDGLGRPIQQVAHMQSNSGKDIITHIEYDQYGRQTREYLPFVSTSASQNYLSSAQSDVLNFYASPSLATTGNPAFEATGNPFSEKQLENSPLDRVFKQAAPGNDWALGSGKEIKFDYQTNTATEVKLFKATATWNAGLGIYDISISQSGDYQANQLYKTITKDENWKPFDIKNNTTEEFKNKSGQVVLKRTYNNNVAHDTYYIYDQYGNLTYVIPPLASDVDITPTVLDNLCYQYKYDNRNRLVSKKLPGKQWEFIVYDKLDRPVATGPAFSPYGNQTIGWMVTQYDVFGRVTQTGWKNATVTAATRNTNQTSINNGGNPFALTATQVLTKNYYDNYSFAGATSPMPSPIESQTATTNVKGLQTGSWVKVLDNATSSTGELSYTVYDYKYRPVHTKTTNHLGGYTQVDTHLDWAGKTLYTLTKHKRTSADTEIVVKDMFSYSPQDKLVVHKQQINSLPEQLITKNSYDELGQLISKNVGGEDVTGAISLQKVDYTYNIRGWLKTINDVNTIGNDLFAFKINYNDADTATDLYNGNISETFWKTKSDNIKRKYDYSYDHLNRLLQADYSKEGSTTFNSYLEHLTYDKNGNIQTLLRNGDMDTDGYQFENPIDDLTYLYDDINKNQLLRVFDATANPSGFKDDTDGTNIDIDVSEAPDYTYDLNGNMIKDTNKGIENIVYNHLNLPIEIVFPTGKINYLYNAIGQKVKKTVTEGTIITTTDYLTGFQYKNAVLQFFPHAEGYVNATELVSLGGGTSYKFHYVFNYTDHLGNIRLSYSKDPVTNALKIIEENHYYPFGLKHSGYNSDKMMYSKEGATLKIKPVPPLFITSYMDKFNGQSWETDLGLNITAMDYRQYDNAIGRFYNIDKMTDIMPSLSPYRFAFNNPVLWADPSGLLEQGGGDDDVIYTQHLKEVVVVGKRSSSSSEINRPASFSYGLINWSNVDNNRRPTLAQYNKHNGTNYNSFDDYYFHEHYVPAHKKMMKERNESAKTVIGTLAVIATAGVGTAYALPVLAACSPAIQSTVATLATNPTMVSIQSFMYGGVSEYAGANMLANTIGQTVANGGDLSKVNPVSVVASGFNGFAPVVASSAIDLSSEARNNNNVFKNGKTITNNILLNYLGNGAKNGLQLPRSAMSNASFATYQGMINTGVEAVGTGVTNKMNE